MRFQFKQFSVEDTKCAMKIGTDGCLLGAWADVSATENVLDIGTGSGVVALMLAQHCNAMIDAVEIDEEAYKQAYENFVESPWKERLMPFYSSIQNYVKTCSKKYDLIVSCPPYFLNSLKSADKQRKLARHTDSLLFEELISCAHRLLKDKGKFCVIIPFNIVKKFSNAALIEGFYINKNTDIEPKVGAKPMRALLEMERDKRTCIFNSLAILDKEGKSYTSEYKEMTKDFYLNF